MGKLVDGSRANVEERRDASGAADLDHPRGGAKAARKRLRAFVADKLARYGEQRNHPDAGCESGLSPYLLHILALLGPPTVTPMDPIVVRAFSASFT